MLIDVRQEPLSALAEYAAVPIAFEVRRILALEVVDGGMGGFWLSERAVEPYVKDYDADGGGPARWAERFDLSRWGLLGARVDGRLIGGAAVAFDTPEVTMLEGRGDLAVLWDIRVAPEARGRGVGAALFRAAAAWAAAHGCGQLTVETQNVNLPACRFYARQGCVLGGIHRFAYPGLPHEVQLLWYRDLQAGT
ncbi:GNAT family N-acetyltransferase [Longimicrobium sp.]|uniref:GNAT family N-acetyltransferase n=1 Tax=Longimicrobium sp. TaxID=2029185 RepID=UPI003B3B59EE